MKKIIGSDKNADIRLSGRYIAKEHAELYEIEDSIYLLDLDSQFGTFVNGKRIKSKTELRKGDRVKIGTQLFHWQNYLESSSKTTNKYPIYFKDLFDPRGFIDGDSYRVSLLIFIGFLILTPFAIPAFLTGFPYIFRENTQRRIEELDLLQYSSELTLSICLVLIYIILNLSQKLIRLKLKSRT